MNWGEKVLLDLIYLFMHCFPFWIADKVLSKFWGHMSSGS